MPVPWGRLPSQDTTLLSDRENNANDEEDDETMNRSTVMNPRQESDVLFGMTCRLLRLGSKQRLIIFNNVAPFSRKEAKERPRDRDCVNKVR